MPRSEFWFRDDIADVLRSALEAGEMSHDASFLAGYVKALAVVARAFNISLTLPRDFRVSWPVSIEDRREV